MDYCLVPYTNTSLGSAQGEVSSDPLHGVDTWHHRDQQPVCTVRTGRRSGEERSVDSPLEYQHISGIQMGHKTAARGSFPSVQSEEDFT